METLPTTVVQHGTRTVGEVTCVIENDDLKLLPNTNVSVAVVTARQENALTVPREAIHQDAEGQYVFQVVNGELKTPRREHIRGKLNPGRGDRAVSPTMRHWHWERLTCNP